MASNLSETAKHVAGRVKVFMLGLAVAAAAGLALYIYVSVHWVYAEGERAGQLQKFSRKGWFCKTYEGELAVSMTNGLAPVIWEFTVRDEALIEKMNGALGKRVVLQYEEHKAVPSTCFGDTPYFVAAVRTVD